MPLAKPLYPTISDLYAKADAIVSTPCDLLTEPLHDLLNLAAHSIKGAKWALPALSVQRNSQLLLGEAVLILQTRGDWSEVEALCQPSWNGTQFVGMKGWVASRCLASSLDSSSSKLAPPLIVTSDQAVGRLEPDFNSSGSPIALGSWLWSRQEKQGWHETASGWIYDKDLAAWDWMQEQEEFVWRWNWPLSALRFSTSRYVLGGMNVELSPALPTGIDCSGLIHLSARRLGLIVPRDAKDQYQWLKAEGRLIDLASRQKGAEKGLQTGDLLFLAPLGLELAESEAAIDHVMLYSGEDVWLESTRTKEGFFRSLTSERLGRLEPIDQEPKRHAAASQPWQATALGQRIFLAKGWVGKAIDDGSARGESLYD